MNKPIGHIPEGFPPADPLRPHVKVCGLTRAEDALAALSFGASFFGLIFAEGTPRCLTREEAAALVGEVRANADNPVRPVGVFVHEPLDMIRKLIAELGLAAVQLHGDHTPEETRDLGVPVLQAVRMKGPESAGEIETAREAGRVPLLDAFVAGQYGGTGKVFDHDLAVPHIMRGPVFIAGGLNPDNIRSVSGKLKAAGAVPYAFDISSGLEEKPRVKSMDKMERFFGELRKAF